MRGPNFVRLAQIDDQGFISACRHGLVHLTWGRTTTRFTREEFRRLVGLLDRAADALPPASAHDGELSVTCRLDGDCELRAGPLVLLLSPEEFQALVGAAREAVRRLDRILAAGTWDAEEPEDDEPSFLEQLRRNPFSPN
jgi:hypothetical protein